MRRLSTESRGFNPPNYGNRIQFKKNCQVIVFVIVDLDFQPFFLNFILQI